MFRILFATTVCVFATTQASALSVSFIQPDGIVGADENIEVLLRITSDTDFNFDGLDIDGSYGIDPALIPTEGFFINDDGLQTVAFAEYGQAFTSYSFTCSGSFSDGGDSVCPPGSEYDFEFAAPGPDSFGGMSSYSLSAGDSQDFLFGTFVPLDGSAAPGTYNFFGASITVLVTGTGFDMFGNQVDLFRSVTLATTCTTGDTGCDFSRVVVPVPAAAWLFGSALLGFAGLRRRA